jgi:diacylglycerol kinase family enzyme
VAIVNPATRRPAGPIVALLQERVPPGVTLDVRETDRAGATERLALAALPGADLLVAVGGDGTVAGVASAIGAYRAGGGPDVPIAIVPAGSTNITARELRIPVKPEAAIDLLFGRRPNALATIDLGRCDDTYFLHMAGAGLDSRLFAETDPALKRKIGWLAYLPPTIRNLRAPAARYRIVADPSPPSGQAPPPGSGEVRTILTVESPLVLVANGGAIVAPKFQLFPEIRTDDGWLDVLVFTPRSRLAIAQTLARAATLSLHRSPYVLRLRARQIALEAEPPQPVQLDGDLERTTPVTFSVLPAALRVVVPAR